MAPGGARSIVVFLHERGDPIPQKYLGWLDYLAAHESAVVFPRYESAASRTPQQTLVALRGALSRAERHLARLPVNGFGGGPDQGRTRDRRRLRVRRDARLVRRGQQRTLGPAGAEGGRRHLPACGAVPRGRAASARPFGPHRVPSRRRGHRVRKERRDGSVAGNREPPCRAEATRDRAQRRWLPRRPWSALAFDVAAVNAFWAPLDQIIYDMRGG